MPTGDHERGARTRVEGVTNGSAATGLRSPRPTIYLDQWVWIRLARAAEGKPDGADASRLLESLLEASDAGVAFPLSWTHYIETDRIKNLHQRRELAQVVASISHFRTIRWRRDLLRNQLLVAMHEQFGRPTFRPATLDPLGLGVHWAFQGVEGIFEVHDSAGDRIELEQFPPEMRIRATQGFECQVLAGPADGEERTMREQYGWRPEAGTEVGNGRLQWEQQFVELLATTPPKDPAELRVWIQAREVVHENLELLEETFKEYGLPLRRLTGGFGDDPEQRRTFISGFFDRMPSLRVAVDLKLAVHRNNQRGWKKNDIYDIDAMSIAVPYCDVVVADKATADALNRPSVREHHDTLVYANPLDLFDVLPQMIESARELPDSTGWEKYSPGVGFNPLTPDQVADTLRKR